MVINALSNNSEFLKQITPTALTGKAEEHDSTNLSNNYLITREESGEKPWNRCSNNS